MAHNNAHRLARARHILMGAQIAMGITHSGSELQSASKPQVTTLSRGIYSISGAQGAFNEALASCAYPHSWIAVVGLPEIGWERLSERGICLERIVVIPSLDIASERVLYTLASVMDILCVGDISLNAASRKGIAAKARQKSCTILTATPWPGLSRSFPLELQGVQPLAPHTQEAVGI